MLNIEARVFSRIKNKFPSNVKQKYSNLNFTTSDRIPTNPKFPSVYIHETGSSERGNDLANTSINAIQSTIQVEVIDNESMSNAKEVMDCVVEIMKTMRYNVVTMPEFQNTSDVYRKVARFRRIIGSGDVL